MATRGATIVENPIGKALQESAAQILRFALESRRLNILEEGQRRELAMAEEAHDQEMFLESLALEPPNIPLGQTTDPTRRLFSRWSGIPEEEWMRDPLLSNLIVNRTEGADQLKNMVADNTLRFIEGMDENEKQRFLLSMAYAQFANTTPGEAFLDEIRTRGLQRLQENPEDLINMARVGAGLEPTTSFRVVNPDGTVSDETVDFDSATQMNATLRVMELTLLQQQAQAEERDLTRKEEIEAATEIVELARDQGISISRQVALEFVRRPGLVGDVMQSPHDWSPGHQFVAQTLSSGALTAEAVWDQILRRPEFSLIQPAIGLLESEAIQRLPVEERLSLAESVSSSIAAVSEQLGVPVPMAIIREQIRRRTLGHGPRIWPGGAGLETPEGVRGQNGGAQAPSPGPDSPVAQSLALGAVSPLSGRQRAEPRLNLTPAEQDTVSPIEFPAGEVDLSPRDRALHNAARKIHAGETSIGKARAQLKLNADELATLRSLVELLEVLEAEGGNTRR